jgi:hypothetical protein
VRAVRRGEQEAAAATAAHRVRAGCRSVVTAVVHRAPLAALSPYLTARIQRFGVYATDEITLTPDAYDTRLGIDLAEAG